ncbi:DoxX family membrane protein [Agromyces binzhouensis]|uniref:DoxX family membrane protein n=1 Tax=Agromyces binzhouensis TaxID=1817495 RepID=A0A4Q2JPC1_9MICO|nr:DoxX family membrane protein [Agromyces binzhouensis]RXZ49832.1 DoxX family membrane protein [Agromyces binzhouensis]
MTSISAHGFPQAGARRAADHRSPSARLADAEGALKALLERWSIPALRVALGAVFVVFGALKFVPGASPVEPLVEATWGVLTFGLVGGQLALVLTAVIETTAGLLLISGRTARLGLVVLAVAFVGILSPIVFFTDQLVTAGGPTLLGQYVAKNVVLIAAALVIASRVLRGPARSR